MSSTARGRWVLRGDLPPDLVREPLQPLSGVRQLANRERWRMIGEMARQLDHLVEQLAQNDVLTSLAPRLRH